MKTKIILGLIILIASILYIIKGNTVLPGVAVFIVASFGLLALSMNYKKDGTERNSWDVWFFSMPGVIVALIFIGVMVGNIDVWKWIVVALGGIVGLESLSSIIKKYLEG